MGLTKIEYRKYKTKEEAKKAFDDFKRKYEMKTDAEINELNQSVTIYDDGHCHIYRFISEEND